MNHEDSQNLIDLTQPSEKNRFPILAQLGILSFILLGIFGTLFVVGNQKPVTGEIPPAEIYVDTEDIATLDAITDVHIKARGAYVWDVRTQRALFAKNEDEILPLASITKLMTTLLSYELIEQNELTTISSDALSQDGNSGLAVGEQIDIADLTELALIASSNDAAYELGASVGAYLGDRDPAAQFVTAMNIKARDLGLNTLEFKNMTGLDLSVSEPGAVGSARDVSFLMEHIINTHPEILTPTQQAKTKVYNTAGEYHSVENTNHIVDSIPNLIGSKTGYTDLAGGNLTIAFDLGYDRPIIITVLGSTYTERFNDVMTLVEAVEQSVK